MQLANFKEPKSRQHYKSAEDLARHLPRLVKVVKEGVEFPPDISKGDVIQVLGEVTDKSKTFLR